MKQIKIFSIFVAFLSLFCWLEGYSNNLVKSEENEPGPDSWDWQTSTNWQYKIYNNYMIRNNIWGETVWTGTGVGDQTIFANSERNWKIIATHKNGTGNATGQVKAYPQMVRGWVQGGIGNSYTDGSKSPFVTNDHGLNQKIDDLEVFNLYHKLELPRKGRYMVLYDLYFYKTEYPSLPYESNKPDMAVMLFTNFWDDTGWLYESNDQKISIGNRYWRYRKSTGSSIVRPGGVVYLLSPYVDSNPVNPEDYLNEDLLIDFKEILHYLRDNKGLDGSLRISTLQLGIEIIEGGEFVIQDFDAEIEATNSDTTSANAVLNYDQDIIKVFPNPAKNSLNIHLPEGTSQGTFQLMNIDGKVIMQESLRANNVILNVENILPGTYLARVLVNEENFTTLIMFY